MPKVLIVNGGLSYNKMFTNRGWEVTDQLMLADLVVFTGGADVWPKVYKSAVHRRTSFNKVRDLAEIRMFNRALRLNKPMAGICRGGQFLNVMNGGKLFQDVDNHALMEGHDVYDTLNDRLINCSSTHHQMMIPNEKDGQILGLTLETRCNFKEFVDSEGIVLDALDVEDVWDWENDI